MDDLSALSDEELDALLLAHAKPFPRKVAMIIASAMHANKNYEVWNEERLNRRIVALVDDGTLEGVGNLTNWRSSEVWLPPPVQ